MQACPVSIQSLPFMFLFYILKYVDLCVFLNVTIISWEGECVPRLGLFFG